jgi:phospholipase C
VRAPKLAAIFDQDPCPNANLNAGRGQPLGDRWECRAIAACPSPDHAVIARELICEPPLRPVKFRDRTLPAISFYKPIGADDEHPGYASLARGDYHAAAIIHQIQQSFIWDDAAIIVTSAENGCTWDHVAPPKIDRWGAGTRVPTIIISPFAERHFIDHTTYETSSIVSTGKHAQTPPLKST